uniref:Ribokinase n=1 Tax=Angiostrongylus cantonensis TaxID=6313 RepID=A0A0K0D0Q4_ANGCA
LMESKKIVVFGSVVQDLVSYTKSFPRPGESVRGTSFHMASGGKGANQAVAAAKLGATVQLIARVGNDPFGQSNIDDLRKSGVDTSEVETSDSSHTATATITVNEQGENTIVVTLGANMELNEQSANRHETALDKAGLVMTQAEIPREANRRIFELAKKRGVKTFFNPAPGESNPDKVMMALTDIVCMNESEAEFITTIPQHTLEDVKKAAAQVLNMGPQHSIVTLGSKGCILATKDEPEIVHIPVPKVTAVDTTGAGDCFCGALAYFVVHGAQCIKDAVERAAVVASLSVTRKGTQASYLSRAEIEREYPNLLR